MSGEWMSLRVWHRTVFTVRSLHGISFDINRDDVLDSTQVGKNPEFQVQLFEGII